MSQIVNVNSLNNINSKKTVKNLSFQIGEIFLAKIMDLDKINNEVLIKMLDGWQFSAKLQESFEFIPQGLVKFQVEGFEDEKIVIKMIADLESHDENYSSFENILKEQNIYDNKKDIAVLKLMVRHGMSLTKENISDIKNIVDFKEKIISNPEEKNKFINDYLNSKNIDIQSNEGIEIRKILEGFFIELEDLSLDELLTMKENSIDLTKENIKSFKKLFTEYDDVSLYSKFKLMNINNIIDKNEFTKENISEFINKDINNEDMDGQIINREIVDNEDIDGQIINREIVDNEDMDGQIIDSKDINNKIIEDNATDNEDINSKNIGSKDVDFEGKKGIEIKEDLNTSEIVKNQISVKTEEMKKYIKNTIDRIEAKHNFNNENFKNVSSILKENINDLKVFNSISNQYYYLDLPIDKGDFKYQCKLIIKDERKNGKVIDSKNVKMAISVKTSNIGVVDTYIHVKKENMNIEMQCDQEWVSLLDSSSEKMIKRLSNLKYNIFVNVRKKENKDEINLVNCREFFNDNAINTISVVV